MTQWILNNALPLIATVLLAYSYIPQLVKTYRTKSVDDVSPAFWWSISAALALMTVNAAYVFYLTGGYGYLITEIINLSLAVAMLTLVLRYRKGVKATQSYLVSWKGEHGDLDVGEFTVSNVANIQRFMGTIIFRDTQGKRITEIGESWVTSIIAITKKRKGDD